MKQVSKLMRLFLPASCRERFDELRLGYTMVTHEQSYLKQTGFLYSKISEKELLSDNQEVIPWMNYPAIEFLKERINASHNIFEYGSGASSLFFAKRARRVISIEYDEKWYHKVKDVLHPYKNAEVYFVPVGKAYIESCMRMKGAINILIVDGRERVACSKFALDCLADDGVVIFDDSDRERYREGLSYYQNKGFKKLSFRGLKPNGIGTEETSILYRSQQNCFGL